MLPWTIAVIPLVSSAILLKLFKAHTPLALVIPFVSFTHPITWIGVLIFVGATRNQRYILPAGTALFISMLWLPFAMAKGAPWIGKTALGSTPKRLMSTRYVVTSAFAFIGGLALLGTRVTTSIDTRFLAAIAMVYFSIVLAFFFFEGSGGIQRKQQP